MREHVPDVAPHLRIGGREWYLPVAMRALRHPAYRLFWIGQLVSLTGSWMQSTALGWLVFRITGSPLALGTVALAAGLPFTVLTLPAGVLVDRIDRRRIIIAVQVALMLLAFGMAVLIATDRVTFGLVVVFSTLTGIASAVDLPARQSFTIEMVGRDDLMNAVALNASIFNGARLVGPALAGLIVATLGEAPAFALNGFTFLAVLAALLAMRLPPAAPRPPRKAAHVELREGLTFIARDRNVLALCIMAAWASFFGFPFTTLVPAMAAERLGLGAKGFGVLLSCMGVGALVGAVSLATARGARTAARLHVARVGFAIGLATFAFSTWLPLSMVAMVVAGWGLITHLASTNTLIQLIVPDSLRGRVMAAYLMGVVGSAPLGNLVMAAAAERWGVPAAIGAGAVSCLLAVVLSLTVWPRALVLPSMGGDDPAGPARAMMKAP